VLLLGAGLLFASFRQVLASIPGFNTDGVLTASITAVSRTTTDTKTAADSHEAPAGLRRAARRQRRRRHNTDPVWRQQQRQRDPGEGPMKPGESLISPSQVHVIWLLNP